VVLPDMTYARQSIFFVHKGTVEKIVGRRVLGQRFFLAILYSFIFILIYLCILHLAKRWSKERLTLGFGDFRCRGQEGRRGLLDKQLAHGL
jgi:hypothetical protein